MAQVAATGNIEVDDAAEAEVVRGAVQIARDTMKANTDGAYWFCLVFQSRDQVQEFLAATGWRQFRDSSLVYVDGIKVAEKMGIALPPDMRHDTPHAGDKRLVNEVGVVKPSKRR